MIISNSGKFIYIHIPKCGGTTISSFFEQYLGPQDVSLNLNPHVGWDKYLELVRKKFGIFKHSTALEIAKSMGLDAFSEYEVFTFSRNPFARAYSAYRFTLIADARFRPESDRYKEIKDMSFEQFLESKYMQEFLMLPAQPQIRWIAHAPIPVRVYKLEEATEILPHLLTKFYKKKMTRKDIDRKNFSTEIDEWKNISKRAEELIRGLYAEDFEAFGYPSSIAR
ncbi:MAG: sulfotransferase family 2 domain-containing protein [Pararhodobacter sp.]